MPGWVNREHCCAYGLAATAVSRRSVPTSSSSAPTILACDRGLSRPPPAHRMDLAGDSRAGQPYTDENQKRAIAEYDDLTVLGAMIRPLTRWIRRISRA